MMNYYLLVPISLLSGLLVFIPSLSKKGSTKLILSFSGSFLLSICLLHIIPEIFSGHHDHHLNLGIYLMIGFFLQLILDYFSGGIEHGHTHVNQKKLEHFPLLIFIFLYSAISPKVQLQNI